jgi:hypothetical protein
MGAILWEYNLNYAVLGVLYSNILKDSHDTAMAMWHSIQNDDQKRKILLAAAEINLINRQEVLQPLKWLINKIGKLSAYRNIAAHLPVGLEEDGKGGYVVAPGAGLAPPTTAQKFIFVQLEREKFWEVLAEDFYMLGQYGVWVAVHLSANQKKLPLPYKPRLPSLAAIQRVDQIIEAQNRPKPTRRTRRLPSRSRRAAKTSD